MIPYTDEGQQGGCMSPGAVARTTVDRLIEQAEKQWELQDHPGWDILEDYGASEGVSVGAIGGSVVHSTLSLLFSHFCQTSASMTQVYACLQKLSKV